MKRAEIETLVNRGQVPWIVRLKDTRTCLVIITTPAKAGKNCSSPAGWAFTAGPESTINGGVYCFSHLMMIMSRGEEQVRLEDHLKAVGKV